MKTFLFVPIFAPTIRANLALVMRSTCAPQGGARPSFRRHWRRARRRRVLR
jgi:hypothetical protein